MNSDLPRIITLLRKERGISQKNAAQALGISQALLSHYEKGIRSCGLDFIVKAADYYNVSCDYLLGRSPEPTGHTLSYDDIPELDNDSGKITAGTSMMSAFNRKLIVNSLNVLFALVQKTGSSSIMKAVSSYLMLSIYKMFRIVYSANPKHDPNFFTVNEAPASCAAAAAMSMCEAEAAAASKGVSFNGNDVSNKSANNIITASSLSEEYPGSATSLLNVIKNSEAYIKMMTEK